MHAELLDNAKLALHLVLLPFHQGHHKTFSNSDILHMQL